MTNGKHEQAVAALFATLRAAALAADPLLADVVRNNPTEIETPTVRPLWLVKAGAAGDPVESLSPHTFLWTRRAEVEIALVPASTETALDAAIQAVGDALRVDPTLGGVVQDSWPDAPTLLQESPDGATIYRAAIVPINMMYTSLSALG